MHRSKKAKRSQATVSSKPNQDKEFANDEYINSNKGELK